MLRLLRAFRNAFCGLFGLLRSELNFRIHVLALGIVVLAGFYLHVSATDWVLLLLTSALVLGLEALNSALEKLCDFITTDRHEGIRKAKDFAAAAVLIASLISIVIAVLVFWKYF